MTFKRFLQNVLHSIKIPKNVEVNFSKTKVKINADSETLFRIFQNLILNSVQSIGNKKGQIGIEIIEEENSVIINVQDSGDGVSEQDQKYIFEPLYTTKLEGTGLGLSIIKNLVEQHQGTINFKNNPTTFIISLPNKN